VIHQLPHRFRRVTFCKDVVVQVIGGDALVLNLRDETVFSLNSTGARIAGLIAAGMALDKVVDTLALEYGAEPSELAEDVVALVDVLLSKGLVVPAPGESVS
jgi:hypothetical protein